MNAPLDIPDAPEIDNIPAPAPLRRPREPTAQTEDREDSGSDRGSKKFTAPGNHSILKSAQAQVLANRNQQTGNRNQQTGNHNINNRSYQDKSSNNQCDKPNRQCDNSDRQSDRPNKPERFNSRQGQDGGRPALRRPQASDEDRRNNGQYYSNSHQYNGRRSQSRVTFAENLDEEDWDSQYYSNSHQYNGRRSQSRVTFAENLDDEEDCDSQAYRSRQQNHHQSASLLDKNRFLNRGFNNYDENWDASKPAPQAKEEPKPSPVKPPVTETPLVRANRVEAAPASANQREAPAANQSALKSPMTNAKQATPADSMPTKKVIPKNCLIELLSQGDQVILSVDRPASECHTSATGFVCVTLNESYGADYEALCEAYGAACEAESPYTPAPGDVFSYFNAEDGGWYRARALSRTHCALIDASKVVALSGARTHALPTPFRHQPEFTALLQATVQVGDNLVCVLVDKTANGWSVELQSTEGARVGGGELSRWLPTVQPAPAAAAIPEVARPDVTNNSTVLMVHVTDVSNVYVRPSEPAATRAFDAVLQDVAMHGLTATPLSEPPTAGSYVLSKYTDDIHYRALVKRTNVKANKYLLEYIEYGNSHINTLDKLYPLPDELQPSHVPAMTSRVALQLRAQQPLTAHAQQYLDTLKDGDVQLVLTIINGAQTAPTGTAVTLTVADSKENVNKKLQDMCTPDWEKLQQRGGDVLQTGHLMYNTVEFLPLPKAPCSLVVTDVSTLEGGTLSVCPHMPDVFDKLALITERMAKYCESELGREPYLPRQEELCIAQMPPYPQWFRAVVAEHKQGEQSISLCYIDYGNLDSVPISLVRKMLPEFMSGLPAVASTVDIKDFPAAAKADPEMLRRALQHLSLDDEGRGSLRAASISKSDDADGCYLIEAPDLIQAMLSG